MALTDKNVATGAGAGAVPVNAPAGNKETDAKRAHQEVLKKGADKYATLNDAEKDALGAKSKTLDFKILLCMDAVQSTRKIDVDNTAKCGTVVGAKFVSAIDIEVPVLDVMKNAHNPYTAADISSRKVKAGEEFFLTTHEAMLLLCRPEYAGKCAVDGVENQCFLSAKFSAFGKSASRIPTPTLNRVKAQIKANMESIDVLGENGYAPLPQYAEKFGALYIKRNVSRGSGNAKGPKAPPAPTLLALAISDMIFAKK